ncbi:MAG: hypothetical protein H6573_23880 [Lewinellaceae bacterium]|nr:hypothetical protein [Phaeodactylibacter sp.]MCB9350529.1 hypothetical protein [Lewinellaceae bacterium]
MKEIKLTLTIEETNQILDALGNQPFKTVFALINKIQSQAAAQLQENGQAAAAPKVKPTPEVIKDPAIK